MKKLLALIALALALFLGGGAYSYHVLAPLEAETDRAWAAADAAITARAAAAPELIAFIHSYTSRGQEAFRAAEDAQKRLAAAQTPAARMAASDALSSALGQLLAAGSRYRLDRGPSPVLRAHHVAGRGGKYPRGGAPGLQQRRRALQRGASLRAAAFLRQDARLQGRAVLQDAPHE